MPAETTMLSKSRPFISKGPVVSKTICLGKQLPGVAVRAIVMKGNIYEEDQAMKNSITRVRQL